MKDFNQARIIGAIHGTAQKNEGDKIMKSNPRPDLFNGVQATPMTESSFDGSKNKGYHLDEYRQWEQPKTDRTETFVQPYDNNIHLVILGDPKPQKRHRSVRMGGFTRQYDPSSADKGDFLSIVQQQAPKEPFTEPLAVAIRFYFTRPKSHFRSGKNSHVMKDTAPLWHTSKPDADNLAKFVLDSMNKIYWKDDSVISDLWIIKQYSDKPRTEIEISLL